MTTGIRAPNDFCWINLMTPEPKKAREFYAALLGWSMPDMPPLGYKIQVGGKDIGGLFDVVSDRTPNGMPPIIGVMVKVANADATVERVLALGGKAQAAFDIAEAGRMAVCHDPNGAEFDVWQVNKMEGTQVDSMAHGAPTWFETITTEPDRAANFYSSLFGWTIQAQAVPGLDYSYIKLGETSIGGIMKITPEMAGMKPHWGVYFAVKNAEDASRDAVKLGGSLCIPLTPIPNVGRFCGVVSPQGVMFCVIEYTR